MHRKNSKYQEYIKNKTEHDIFRFFDESVPLKEYKYWKIILNTFPYDDTKLHHMIIPKRQVRDYTELDVLERAELENIKTFDCKNYDSCIRNFNKYRSVEIWYHEHLLRWK